MVMRCVAQFARPSSSKWTCGDRNATPQWIEGHIEEMLATIERLWGEAMCGPIACAYLERME